MISIAVLGYSLAAFAFLVLAGLMLLNYRGERVGWVVIGSTLASSLWAATLAWQIHAADGFQVSHLIWFAVEMARDAGLLLLLAALLHRSARDAEAAGRWSRVFKGIGAIAAISLVAVTLGEMESMRGLQLDLRAFAIAVFLVLAIIGLLLIEKIFRGTAPEQRWAIKFLCLGTGSAFAFDFYMYSEALLFRAVDVEVWSARGYVNALIVPMLGISVARNPHWSVDVVMSRRVVFQSITLFGAGIYLLSMAVAGYYIRAVGGDWGIVGQTVFLFSALVLLLALMFSGEMRARIKVYFAKHFFRSTYDYREEWLRITTTMSSASLDAKLREWALVAVAELVHSTGGALFQRRGSDYVVTATSNLALPGIKPVPGASSLCAFLREKSWVIDMDEFNRVPARYEPLSLPDDLRNDARIRLIVPLFQRDELLGFVVLGRPRAEINLNWEVRDLLMVTGRQIAGHLALLDANEALIEARQFEAFNRLSAYVVHDLKNLVAQLSLLVSNAARHRHNPAFMDDAINTVANSVDKMNRLLGQLRKGRLETGDASRVSVHAAVREAAQHRAVQPPVPALEILGEDAAIVANAERLTSVLEHLIQNAQEATPTTGRVSVRVTRVPEGVMITVSDTGSGMDEQFIREHLFRPFRTTKGNAGMGIGVYESREFVHAIGGRLEVHSAVGAGTTFTLTLPVASAIQA